MSCRNFFHNLLLKKHNVLYFLEKGSLGGKKEKKKITKIYSSHIYLSNIPTPCYSQKWHQQGGPASKLSFWSLKGKQRLCSNSTQTGLLSTIGKTSLLPTVVSVTLIEFAFQVRVVVSLKLGFTKSTSSFTLFFFFPFSILLTSAHFHTKILALIFIQL